VLGSQKYNREHVKEWANHNNLRLNTEKNKGTDNHQKGKPRPPPTPGITRVDKLNILGVTINVNIRFIII